MTEETRKTYELFQGLMKQLHKDNEVLEGLLQAYAQNVVHLIDLAEKLSAQVGLESGGEEKQGSG
jgi:hypothetical protein